MSIYVVAVFSFLPITSLVTVLFILCFLLYMYTKYLYYTYIEKTVIWLYLILDMIRIISVIKTSLRIYNAYVHCDFSSILSLEYSDITPQEFKGDLKRLQTRSRSLISTIIKQENEGGYMGDSFLLRIVNLKDVELSRVQTITQLQIYDNVDRFNPKPSLKCANTTKRLMHQYLFY